jgi:hypothetical protein
LTLSSTNLITLLLKGGFLIAKSLSSSCSTRVFFSMVKFSI